LVGTNFGISARFYEDVIGRPPSKIDMLSITKVEAESIYLQFFWNKNLGNRINSQSVANTVIDHQVNSGRGIKMAQQVLNNRFGKTLAVDGVMGPNTLRALNSVNAEIFVNEYNNAREQYYISINNPTFINGWLIRLKQFAYSDAFAISSGFIVIAIIAGIIIYKNHAS
jgi:lysozyme family protein